LALRAASDKTFDRIFDLAIGKAGGTHDMARERADNWSGGQVGAGELRGTKWGLCASFLPAVDIGAITYETAKQIYRARFWDKIQGDDLPPVLALLMFDAALTLTATFAMILLRRAVGAHEGAVGPVLASYVHEACELHGTASVCAEFQARRIATWVSPATDPQLRLLPHFKKQFELAYQSASLV
jgi:hypothetical protein